MFANTSAPPPPARLTIVVPCYNEAEVLATSARRLLGELTRLVGAGKIAPDSGLCLVDDGSRDRTWRLIERLAAREPRVLGLKLARNVGHQAALLAGLLTAPGAALVSIDADLQDDPAVIEAMIDQFRQGYDVVYGVRASRASDTLFKRATADAFYRLLRALGAETLPHHADFRLLSRRVVEALRCYPETNLFLRGLIPLVGYPATVVEYTRTARLGGISKYPLRKMIGLALDGVTSLSSVPLRLITLVGLLVFALSAGLGIWALFVKLFTNRAIPGWASTVIPIYFIGGVQLLCLGIIGEYLGKIYREVKRRPRFFIERTLNNAVRTTGEAGYDKCLSAEDRRSFPPV